MNRAADVRGPGSGGYDAAPLRTRAAARGAPHITVMLDREPSRASRNIFGIMATRGVDSMLPVIAWGSFASDAA